MNLTCPAVVGQSLVTRPETSSWPEQSDLRDLVDACRGGNLEDRVLAAFLGTTGGGERRVEVGRLRAALYWHALPGFLAEEGFETLGRRVFGRGGDEVVAPVVELVELSANESLELPTEVLVFARRQDCRVVLSVAHEWGRFGGYNSVGVRSSDGAEDLLAKWGRRVRRDCPLRGRSLTPSGKLVEPGERPPSWEDLFLPETVKEEIRFQVRRLDGHPPEELRRLGIRRRGGLILSGPPGTGKTLTGRILAHSTTSTFLWVSPSTMMDPQQVEEVLELARLLSPTILFLEDLDLVAADRGENRGGVALGELMNQLDGIAGDHDVFTIATTNRVEVVERALRNRPGRFDRVVLLPPPDPECARALLASRLAPHGVDPAGIDCLVSATAGASGAALDELANTVLLLALERGQEGEAPLPQSLLEEALVRCGRTATPGAGRAGFGSSSPPE